MAAANEEWVINMKYTVVVSDNRHKDYEIERSILKECDAELIIADCKSEEQLLKACRAADGILLDLAPMTAAVVQGLDRCKVISRYGVGYDNVDVPACTKRGIIVSNVPDYCAEDVSDLAIGHLLACLRHISMRDRMVREGHWNIARENEFRIRGKTLSLLGFGRIARSLCTKVSGFGLNEILVYDPYIPAEAIEQSGAQKVSLEDALSRGDFISLHMPVTEETRCIINENTLSLMKRTAILINTSRGALVEDSALAEALKNNRIAGAGLDTHNKEPLAKDSPLLMLDNCVLTDHTGYSTEESIVELKTKCALNVRLVLEGGTPPYPINRL